MKRGLMSIGFGLFLVFAAAACGVESETLGSFFYSTVPDEPSGVNSFPGDRQITISWNTVQDADSYNLYWSTTTGVTTGSSPVYGVSSPYTHTGLTNGTTYYYGVTAVNAGGESAPSNEVGATPQVSAPSSPTGVAASAGNTETTLTWDPVSGATSYNIYWNNTGTVTTADNQISGAVSPYTHTGLTNGTTYYYGVTAVNSGGESAPSNEVGATPQVPGSGSPSSVAVIAGDTETTLTWDPVSGATSYNIYWNNTGTVTTADNQISGAVSPYTHTGLTNGTTYYYIVTAFNSGLESSPSNETSATPQVPAPGSPTGVAASAGNTETTLTWDPVSGATSYNIYWNNTGTVTTADNQISGAVSPYMHTGLTYGTTYYYVVTAVNAGGQSAPSGEVGATPSDPNNTGPWTADTCILGPGDGTPSGPPSDDLGGTGGNEWNAWKGFRWPAGRTEEAYVFAVRVAVINTIDNDEDLTYAVYEDNNGLPGNLKVWGYKLGYDWNTIGVGRHYFDLDTVVTNRDITAGNYYWIFLRTSTGTDGRLYMERARSIDPMPPNLVKMGKYDYGPYTNVSTDGSDFNISFAPDFYGWSVWSASNAGP